MRRSKTKMPSQTGKQIADVLESLTHMQRLYVKARLEGLTKVASATAAGQASPQKNSHKFEESQSVRDALRLCKQITADAVAFGRKEAHDMYTAAYHAAATSAEMTMAVNSLVKLHGLAAPEVKELRHKHSGSVDHQHQLEQLSDKDLAQLAKLEDEPWLEGEFEEVSECPEPLALPTE